MLFVKDQFFIDLCPKCSNLAIALKVAQLARREGSLQWQVQLLKRRDAETGELPNHPVTMM
jgi:hypothetical protein